MHLVGLTYFFSKFVKNINLTRYFIRLAFDGSNYHGWQSQQNAVSVQSELEKCLSLKLGTSIKLTGCGRTDTGVHAREYFAHFDLEQVFDFSAKTAFLHTMNQFLPLDIVLFDVFQVNDNANARFDAISRTYRYYIHRQKNPFIDTYSLLHYGTLNLTLMQKACGYLFDYEDFTSFSKLHSKTKTNFCQIIEAKWEESDDGIVFTITANRFLRNMVRAIVGTMLVVGKEKLSLDDFRAVIESKNRSNAGFSVPGNALFLEKVCYPKDIRTKFEIES